MVRSFADDHREIAQLAVAERLDEDDGAAEQELVAADLGREEAGQEAEALARRPLATRWTRTPVSCGRLRALARVPLSANTLIPLHGERPVSRSASAVFEVTAKPTPSNVPDWLRM